MIDYLIDIDTQVFLFFHNMRAPFLDSFMWLFSKKLVWVPLYAAIFVYLFKTFNWKQAVIYTLAIALTITLADQVCASHIRPYFQRLRPSNPSNPLSDMVTIVNGYRSGSYGFPSCHAANTFALAVIVSLIAKLKRISVFMFVWAIITCYSRVYLGVHYPGDLLFGAVIGCTCSIAVYYAASGISSRMLPRSDTRRHNNRILNIIDLTDIIILTGSLTIVVFVIISLCKI